MKVTRWFEEEGPTEAAIRERMAAEGLTPGAWSNQPGDTYEVHAHGYHKVIYVVQGMIRFTLPDSPEEYVDLMAGDRLDLPAGVRHGALVGPAGVTCLEARR